MANIMTRSVLLPLIVPALLAACVSQSNWTDLLEAQNQELQQRNTMLSQQVAAEQAKVSRLQGAIKYTVNSDLLFAPGGWKISSQGKQIIAKMASQLAPLSKTRFW